MEKLTLIMLIVILLPTVKAIYGGETFTYHFPYCEELKVNITGELPIDEGEYTILNNCTEVSTNYYICNCNDDYYFNVSFKINTINTYTFDFNYDYSKETETQTRSRSGSSSSGSHSWVCGEWSECINNETKRVCWLNNANYTQYKGCVSPEEEDEKGSNGNSHSESREEPEQEMQTSPEITTNQKTQGTDGQEPPTSMMNRITGAVTGFGEGSMEGVSVVLLLTIFLLFLLLYKKKKK